MPPRVSLVHILLASFALVFFCLFIWQYHYYARPIVRGEEDGQKVDCGWSVPPLATRAGRSVGEQTAIAPFNATAFYGTDSDSVGGKRGFLAATTHVKGPNVVLYIAVLLPSKNNDVLPASRTFVRLVEPNTGWVECTRWEQSLFTFPMHCAFERGEFEKWERRAAGRFFEISTSSAEATDMSWRFPFEVTHSKVEEAASFRAQRSIASQVPISICAWARNEGWFLVEWLEYHLWAGFRDIHLYFHTMDDYHKTLMKPYLERGFITVDIFPNFTYPSDVAFTLWQTLAMSHCFSKYNHSAEWTAVFDIDEFVMPSLGKLNVVEAVCHQKLSDPNAAAFRIQQVGFGHDHILPFGPLVSTFRRFPYHSSPQGWGGHKTIARTEMVGSYVIHHPGSVYGPIEMSDPNNFFMGHFHSRCMDRDKAKSFVLPAEPDSRWSAARFVNVMENLLRNVHSKFFSATRIDNKCNKWS